MTHAITIVGGGPGGAITANRLADDLVAEIDAGDVSVTLVTDSPDHEYKPLYLYVAFGQREPRDAHRPLRDLLDRRVDVHIGHVSAVETDAKRLELDDGETLDYDSLVLTTGSTLVPERIPGLVEGGHEFYSAGGAERLRDALATFESGRIVLTVAGTPHMCPAAPLEFVFILDDWLRSQGRRDDVELVYTYPAPRVHAKQHIAEWALPLLDERGIRTETSFDVVSVDPDEQVVRTETGETLDYDLLVAIPPHRGVDLIADAGLGDDWAEVDQYTLESLRAPDVYALGDAAALPTAKAGSAAHFQAGVVADRIASTVRGQIPTARYDGRTVCFIETGLDEATFVSFKYGEEPLMRAPSKYVHWTKVAYNETYWLTARGVL